MCLNRVATEPRKLVGTFTPQLRAIDALFLQLDVVVLPDDPQARALWMKTLNEPCIREFAGALQASLRRLHFKLDTILFKAQLYRSLAEEQVTNGDHVNSAAVPHACPDDRPSVRPTPTSSPPSSTAMQEATSYAVYATLARVSCTADVLSSLTDLLQLHTLEDLKANLFNSLLLSCSSNVHLCAMLFCRPVYCSSLAVAVMMAIRRTVECAHEWACAEISAFRCESQIQLHQYRQDLEELLEQCAA